MIAMDMNHELLATFLAEEGMEAKHVCKITANGTVGPCQSGEAFCGMVSTVRGGYAGVVLHGVVTASYSGAAPAVGKTALCADGKGGVTAGGNDTCLVLDVDDAAKTVKLFL